MLPTICAALALVWTGALLGYARGHTRGYNWGYHNGHVHACTLCDFTADQKQHQ